MDAQQIELNALFEDMILEDMSPMASKKVAVVLGRFNPPTKGHYAVIDEVKKFIRKNKNLGLEAAPAVVIIGGSKSDSNKKKNPLTTDERELFMKASGKVDGVKFFVAPNAFSAFSMLRDNGLEPIAVAAGTDRIQDYIKILDKYFLTPDEQPIKHYAVHLSRDEEAFSKDKDAKRNSMDRALDAAKSGDEIETDLVSGSLARRAVELGYEPEFAQIVGLEDKPALASKMFKKIANALGE